MQHGGGELGFGLSISSLNGMAPTLNTFRVGGTWVAADPLSSLVKWVWMQHERGESGSESSINSLNNVAAVLDSFKVGGTWVAADPPFSPAKQVCGF